jgi:hypothetical protein
LGLSHFLRRDHDEITIRFARAPAKKAFRYDVPLYQLPGREEEEAFTAKETPSDEEQHA